MCPVTVTRSGCAHRACGFRGLSAVAIGPAKTAITMLTGIRTTRVQVSSADAVCLTCAAAAGSVAARSAGRASTGTMMLVSAPPRTTS